MRCTKDQMNSYYVYFTGRYAGRYFAAQFRYRRLEN